MCVCVCIKRTAGWCKTAPACDRVNCLLSDNLLQHVSFIVMKQIPSATNSFNMIPKYFSPLQKNTTLSFLGLKQHETLGWHVGTLGEI